ncbi:MAG: GGDEF domain-containing protein [Methylococcaceae bacterium]
MDLFKKLVRSTDSVDDKWKSRYLLLLDDYDETKKNHQNEQVLLKKTLIRLVATTKGLDPHLDPYLVRIRTHLKSELDIQKLWAVIEEFSDTVLQSDSPTPTKPHVTDTTVLCDILHKLYPHQKEALSAIQSKYEGNGFPSTQDLMSAILGTLETTHAVEPPHANDNVSNKGNTHNTLTTEQIITPLSRLLNTLDIPPNFETRVQQLKKQLQSNPAIEPLKSIISDYIKLFLDIKQHVQLEHRNMATFLSNLTEQLSELGLKASGASHAAQVSSQKRTLLDESVSAQMSDLQKSSADATTLEPLKQLIKSRLANIRTEIQEHAKNEELQRQETEKQLNDLTLKINLLDAESSELKTKLTAAYEKATRDPLTNLPNRLAYEEATHIEMARWQRYQTPLTMAIWDIDLFKIINDTHGHKAGDKTLIIIAQLLSKHCRKSDFVARFGGEEFIMLLPNTTEQSAVTLTNKIRTVIEKTGFNAGGQHINITISCGLSEFRTGDTSGSVFERADQALYQSKANGRNQCIVAQ